MKKEKKKKRFYASTVTDNTEKAAQMREQRLAESVEKSKAKIIDAFKQGLSHSVLKDCEVTNVRCRAETSRSYYFQADFPTVKILQRGADGYVPCYTFTKFVVIGTKPEKFTEWLNDDYNDYYLVKEDEYKAIEDDYDVKMQPVREFVEDMKFKYDIDAEFCLRPCYADEAIVIEFTKEGASIGGYDLKELEERCHNHKTVRQTPYFVLKPLRENRWNVNKSYEENYKKIDKQYAKAIAGLEELLDALDNWDDFTDGLEDELADFQARYQADIPGLQISNVSVDNWDCEVKFDLEAYQGAIDLTVELSYSDCKTPAILEKKLLGIIKYRKRKYGIH